MTITSTQPCVAALWDAVDARIAGGGRFAGLFAAPARAADTEPGGGVTLSAHVAVPGGIDTLQTTLPPGAAGYPALTPRQPAAFWYERVIHDQTGIVPEGHSRLAPLVGPGDPDDHTLPRHVAGYGVFTIPHGPVRSGVLESMEYLVETPGEAIPHLNMRIFYKHRGIAARFTGMSVADAVLLAERAEGIASVAHALAFCHAVEAIAGCQVPREAGLVRVAHAELERIANHLDVAMRLADAAGLAVATTRFALHKERVLRLVSALCGSRFGRGVVVPGGVSAWPDPSPVLPDLARLEKQVKTDADAVMATSSFLDRIRGTGPLDAGRAREHGALGPIGKASGYADDDRLARPYDAYPLLAVPPAGQHVAGDALARLRVRWEEVDQAFRLIWQALSDFPERSGPSPHVPCPAVDGRATGWAEAPQGEVLYDLTIEDGRIARCQPRSASFHDLVLMHQVFAGDILTDFPFIEASFGLSVAGAAM
ncbi:NADH-quinone oxidoreductase subunit C [Trebonia sp.]|uniref:hydrogenase large subunit n=1 Tax=Trebonia sp. TaxID=2767075 RepID=UPI002622216C|nr:NADH-quinone oxidoreductase subunit C [Trebonia sp.]